MSSRLERTPGRTHDGRREAGENARGREKRGQECRGLESWDAEEGGACPLLRGRIEIVRERGKAAGAQRRNVERTRSGQSVEHIHGGGAARAGEGAFGGEKAA